MGIGGCNTNRTSGCSDNQLAVQVIKSTKDVGVQLDGLLVVLNDLQVALNALCDDESNYLQLISGVLTDIINADNECCDTLAGKLTTLKNTIHNYVNICGEVTVTTTMELCGLEGSIECNGANYKITIQAGEDVSDTLDLYYWDTVGSIFVWWDSISKANLVAGYSFFGGEYTRWKVQDNLSSCSANVVLEADSACSTTTTAEAVTTTSSTTSTAEPETTTTSTDCGDSAQLFWNLGAGTGGRCRLKILNEAHAEVLNVLSSESPQNGIINCMEGIYTVRCSWESGSSFVSKMRICDDSGEVFYDDKIDNTEPVAIYNTSHMPYADAPITVYIRNNGVVPPVCGI